MVSAYAVLWTNDRCRWLKQCGDEGMELSVMFGGIHQSAPSLKRAGVAKGDQVFAVRVLKGRLYVIARLTAGRFIPLEAYAIRHLDLPAPAMSGRHEFQLLQHIQEHCPDLGHRMPYGCDVEVLLAAEGSPIRFDLAVPPAVLETLTFCSQRARRKLKHVEDGVLKRAIRLQGHVRRLCPESAGDLDDLVDRTLPTHR